jgi:hypothetical protein
MHTRKALLSLVMIGGLIASTHPALGYRTAAELPTIASQTPVRWSGQFYGYALNVRTPSGISLSDFEQVVEQAIAVWTVPGCSSATARQLGKVTTAATSGDGLNTVEWVSSGWIWRGLDPTAPGQTDILYERDVAGNWYIKEADIYINGEFYKWDLAGESSSGSLSLRSVLIHESGHAFGLLHACELTLTATAPVCTGSDQFTGAAMHPNYGVNLIGLSADDEAGICSVYPKGLCIDSVCADTETCTATGCRLTCGSTTCDDGMVCWSERCMTEEAAQAAAAQAAAPQAAAKGSSCANSADCQRGLNCISGTCQGGMLRLGDLCQKDEECLDGVCTQVGYCAQSCRDSGNCTEPNAACGEVVEGVGACIGTRNPLGDSCSSASDCLGQQCLVDGERAPVCSRVCSAGEVACPSGWGCAEVEGTSVCVTPLVDSGCGCRVATPLAHQRAVWSIVISGLIAAYLRRGRRWFWLGAR